MPADQAAAPSDVFLDSLSTDSLEVLAHFGGEAPDRLNSYACQIEDALLESLGHQREQADEIGRFSEYVQEVVQLLEATRNELAAQHHILTDPDTLAQYTEAFFGPNGPAPVQTPGEQARTAIQQGLVTADGPLMGRADAEAFNLP
ncbi:MAG: hypothetical protein WBM08_09370, partial [Prochlorococcaceae cyanobacterium]